MDVGVVAQQGIVRCFVHETLYKACAMLRLLRQHQVPSEIWMAFGQLGHLRYIRRLTQVPRAVPEMNTFVGITVEKRMDHRSQRRHASRSEARRVGKEGVSTCRSRGSPEHYKKKKKQ